MMITKECKIGVGITSGPPIFSKCNRWTKGDKYVVGVGYDTGCEPFRPDTGHKR